MSLLTEYGHSQLTEYESKQLMQEYDIPTVTEKLATGPDEAARYGEEVGFPVVLKVESRQVQHKTEAGGVQTADDPEEARQAYQEIVDSVAEYDPEAEIAGVLVEETLDGTEFIVGVNQDPQFGPVLMFGLGGIYVEVFRDVTFRLIPVDEYDASQMMQELDSEPLLDGVRGQPPADRAEIAELLEKVSRMIQEEPEIRELDINPLFVDGDEVIAADALITLEGDA